jgi:uroporphyrinogen III methyltransferase/synthase
MPKKIRIAGRTSPLAIAQVREMMSLLPDVEYEFVPVESYGDKHKEISLLDNAMEDIFTRELDDAVLRGDADCAIHSAKDLPYPLRDKISIAAVTKSADATDSLVSRDGATLAELPEGAVVGLSSPLRREQIIAARPDINILSIRGNIQERIEYINRGDADAVIVASIAMKRLGLADRIAEILPFGTNPLQGCLAVTVRTDRPAVRKLFYPLDYRRFYGRVILMGAGPSAPDLLTLRAANILKIADIIFYDDLMDESVLDPYDCEKTYVGKRKNLHSVEQEKINEMLYLSAMDGKTVVRLKGGDPSVYGRSGEEAEYLARRLIPVEIVPGVTSALAAAADSGIPLTMREVSSGVRFAAGHGKDAFSGTPGRGTLVYYMAASVLPDLSAYLIGEGYPLKTPAAIVRNAGSVLEETSVTDIEGLRTAETSPPAIIIIGDTVSHALRQPKFLFTGLEISRYSVRLPGRMVHYPLIRTEEILVPPAIEINRYDAVIFTSKTAVRIFFRKYQIFGQKVFAIGPATAEELRRQGIGNAIVQSKHHSAALAEVIGEYGIERALYPCSEQSDNPLHRIPQVETVVLYRTSDRSQPKIELSKFEGIIFTSPSTVTSFKRLYGNFPENLLYYCIGPVTAGILAEYGIEQEIIIDVSEIP